MAVAADRTMLLHAERRIFTHVLISNPVVTIIISTVCLFFVVVCCCCCRFFCDGGEKGEKKTPAPSQETDSLSG